MSTEFEWPKDGPSSHWVIQRQATKSPEPKPGLDVMPEDYVQDFTKRPEPFRTLATRILNIDSIESTVKGKWGGVRTVTQLCATINGNQIVLTPPFATTADCWAYLESLRTKLSGGDIGFKLNSIAEQTWWQKWGLKSAPVRWFDYLRFWTLDDNCVRLQKAARAFRKLRVAHK